MVRYALSISMLAVMGLVATSPVTAQTAKNDPSAAQPPAVPPAPPPLAAGQDGFVVQSPNGDFRVQIGLLVHADGRFAVKDTNDRYIDNFATRRVRPYLRGRITKHIEFYVVPDFANGVVVLQDAYVDARFAPAFRIRTGKGKTPFGFERLHSASTLLFMERALPTALVPNRDIGVQVLGDISGGVVSYLAGVMNGVADGGSGDVDANDSKDIAGRLVIRPFAGRPASNPVRGLGFGIAGSRGQASGTAALPAFRTQILQQPYFSYATGTTPSIADGMRTRYSPQAWYFQKAFAGWIEYVHTTTPVTRGTTVIANEVDHDAWQVAASWVLTGEATTDSGTVARPRANFDFGNGNWGAFQVAARYHALEVDRAAVTLGLAAAGSSRAVEGWTVGLRWYFTPNLWYTFNFERTVFDDDPNGPRRAENGLAFRTQLFF